MIVMHGGSSASPAPDAPHFVLPPNAPSAPPAARPPGINSVLPPLHPPALSPPQSQAPAAQKTLTPKDMEIIALHTEFIILHNEIAKLSGLAQQAVQDGNTSEAEHYDSQISYDQRLIAKFTGIEDSLEQQPANQAADASGMLRQIATAKQVQ
jgi:hypothetical protein